MQIYNLGHGHFESEESKAKAEFIRKEFPQIQNCASQPHDALIVPEVYLYKGQTHTVRIL